MIQPETLNRMLYLIGELELVKQQIDSAMSMEPATRKHAQAHTELMLRFSANLESMRDLREKLIQHEGGA